MPKGGNAATKDALPAFDVTFDFSIVRAGEPLWASVRAADGRKWLSPVFSQRGAPILYESIGGDGKDATPPPATALGAIYEELKRHWDSGPPEYRLALMAAGFADGVRVPHKPGRQPESPEMLAVRIRRLLEERAACSRDQRRTWRNTEKDVLRRGREADIARGKPLRLTSHGAELVAEVDSVKAAVRPLIPLREPISGDELRVRLGSGASEAAAEAAIFDLEVDGELRLEIATCTCGKSKPKLARGPRWQAPS